MRKVISEKQFKKLYNNRTRTLKDIAKELGCSQTTITFWAKKLNLSLRGKGRVRKLIIEE